MAFTATIYSFKESNELIDKKEDLIELKFKKTDEKRWHQNCLCKAYKNSEKYEKLYRLATRKSGDLELDGKNSPPKLMKQIKSLEHYSFRTTS